MLRFRIPGYSHDLAGLSVRMKQSRVYSSRGFVQSVRKSLSLKGEIQADSFAALTSAIRALENTYGKGIITGEIGLYAESGAKTAHVISSNGSLGGIRVVSGPDYPDGEGAEYSTYRTFEIQLEADYPNLQSELLAFEEQIQVTGTGGPRFVIRETVTGPPIKQLTNRRTSVRAVQSGSAIGLTGYPDIFVPGPAWPQHEQEDQRGVGNRGPRTTAGVFSEFGISWQYKFWSPSPLTGRPHQR